MQQELSEARRNYRLSLEQYELIQEMGSYATFEWDISKDWIGFSREWREWFDQPEDIARFSQYIQGLRTVGREQKSLLLKCIEDVRKGVPFQKCELQLPLKTGEKKWFELRVITQTNEQKEPILGIGTLSDITHQKERIRKLEQEVQMDLFTGLLNKTAIERSGERKLKMLRRGELLAALILDMDDFKDINDTFGHPAGDSVLKEVAAVIQEKAPAGAQVGRIGGDEFMALLITGDLEAFCAYAEALIEAVSRIRWQGRDVGAGCSIGLAAAGPEETSYGNLYRKADNALYQAKQRGKKQICCYGGYCQKRVPEGSFTAEEEIS